MADFGAALKAMAALAPCIGECGALLQCEKCLPPLCYHISCPEHGCPTPVETASPAGFLLSGTRALRCTKCSFRVNSCDCWPWKFLCPKCDPVHRSECLKKPSEDHLVSAIMFLSEHLSKTPYNEEWQVGEQKFILRTAQRAVEARLDGTTNEFLEQLQEETTDLNRLLMLVALVEAWT